MINSLPVSFASKKTSHILTALHLNRELEHRRLTHQEVACAGDGDEEEAWSGLE